MNPFIPIDQLEIIMPLPGLRARVFHTDNQTYAFWEIDEGSPLPEHSHPHSQVSLVTKGELELTIDNETRTLRPGMMAVIPPEARHSAVAITDVEVTDIFDPIREDFREAAQKIELQASLGSDLGQYLQLLDEAIEYQKSKGGPYYHFDESLALQHAMQQGDHYRLKLGDQLACFFDIAFSDRAVWGKLENGSSLYLYRIISNRALKGKKLFRFVLDWSIRLALDRGLNQIRLHTWAESEDLVEYYKSFGFKHMGVLQLGTDEGISESCQGQETILLEYDLTQQSNEV